MTLYFSAYVRDIRGGGDDAVDSTFSPLWALTDMTLILTYCTSHYLHYIL